MTNTQIFKEKRINSIIELVSDTYKSESGMAKLAKQGLSKLTKNELNAVYMLVWTTVPFKAFHKIKPALAPAKETKNGQEV